MKSIRGYIAGGLVGLTLIGVTLGVDRYLHISTDRQTPTRSTVSYNIGKQEKRSLDKYLSAVVRDVNNEEYQKAAQDAHTIPVLGPLENVNNLDDFLDYLKVNREGMHVYPSISYSIPSNGTKSIQESRRPLDIHDITSFLPRVIKKEGTHYFIIDLHVDGEINKKETKKELQLPVLGDGKEDFTIGK